MPDPGNDPFFEQLLEYSEAPEPESFVLDVMAGIQRERRTRSIILFIFGVIGAAFGLLGAVLLSDSIARVFVALPATETMQMVLTLTAAFSFYTWFMNDDLSLAG